MIIHFEDQLIDFARYKWFPTLKAVGCSDNGRVVDTLGMSEKFVAILTHNIGRYIVFDLHKKWCNSSEHSYIFLFI